MCSMCHYCGAELAKSIEEKRKQDNGNAVISSTGDPIWSCKLCCGRKGRDFVKQDGITPYAAPMISPIFSLSCSDRSYSSCRARMAKRLFQKIFCQMADCNT
ncbi:hypothetical protein J1N35_017829 [Gossypium stocksii]|uniref:Uncharacterized protein n=1 Tax=Gossypium stocksii TaxID=47602 RepID=A0A9D3VP02_9ROSI|nr:hypothetical protein J1N35_017829 [Gossypium stocksii]